MAKLFTTIRFTNINAATEYERSRFLFECAELANLRGYYDLMEDLSAKAIASFNLAKDIETKALLVSRLANAMA